MLNQQGVQIQPLEIADFSGGMTDSFIAAQNNEFERGDNFYINEYGKPVTRYGLVLDDPDHARVSTDKRINSLFDLEEQLFQISEKKLFYNAGGFTEVKGPANYEAFNKGNEFSFYSVAQWNKQAFLANTAYSKITRLYKDGATWKLSNVGLPAPISTGVTSAPTAGAQTYVFALVYKVEYLNQGVVFEEVSGVSDFIVVPASAAPITLNNLPQLTNGVGDHYDVANVKIDIYRSQGDGDVLFHNGTVTNGTTTFLSDMDDEELANRDPLYITGDRPDHEEPPPAKYLHFLNDVLYLADVKEDGVSYPTRLRLSNRFQPWSCPGSFFEDFEEDIKGLSSIGGNLLVFCTSSTYLVNGFYLPDQSGGIQKRKISDTIGCVSARSIVQTNDGVFWAGNDGFYFTDGSRVMRVSEKINYTYRSITTNANQKQRIYGTLDPVGNRVLWAVQRSDVGTDNDTIFVCHLQFGIKPIMPFTTWSGGSLHPNNFAPTALHYFDGYTLQADTRGYLLKYDDQYLTDLKINILTTPDNWLESTIIYDYRSPAFNFGSSAARKWVPWIIMEADNYSSVSLVISSNNDNSGEFKELKEIKYKNNIEWGDYDILFGDESIRWQYFPLIKTKRRFPAGSLRCAYKQVRFTNAFSVIQDSVELGEATFDFATKTVTLNDPDNIWPTDVLDYYVVVNNKRYRIVGRTDTTLTVEDLDFDLPTGSLPWTINGYRRREILKIISYVLDYSFTSQSQDAYRGSGG